MSKCMADTELLTKAECYNCRHFLEKIHVYFTNNSLQMSLKEEKEEQAQLKKYSETLDKKERDILTGIDNLHAREAKEDELVNHKLKFKSISSYEHKGNQESPANERRALIIGVHRETGQYKFYIIAVPFSANQEEDDKALIKIVNEDLPKKYKDHIFIY